MCASVCMTYRVEEGYVGREQLVGISIECPL